MNAAPRPPRLAPPPPVPPPEHAAPMDDTIDLRAYLALLQKHLWSILAVAAAVLALVAVWTLRQPKVYLAETSLVIDPLTPKILEGVDDVVELGAGGYRSTKEYYETQYRIIQSREVGRRVVEQLGLDRDLDFLGLADIEDPAELEERLAEVDPVAVLQELISVSPVRDSRMVLIGVSDTDPARAALLSRTVAETYRATNVEQRVEGTSSVVAWLDEQIRELKPRLEASELALYEFKRENDMLSASLEDRQNMISQKLMGINEALTAIRTQRVALESKVNRIRDLRRAASTDDRALDSLAEVTGNQLIQKLKENLFTRIQQYAELEEKYLARHPKLLAAQESLQAARQALDREVGHLVAGIENEYASLRETESATQRLLDETKAEAFELNKKEIAYGRLARDKEDNQRLYDLVLNRMKEANLSGQQRTNNVQVVDAAVVPQVPVKPRTALNLLLGLVLGLFLGVGQAFVREFLDNTVKTQEDVEGGLGLPFLGLVPSSGEKSGEGLFILEHPHSPLAEASRSIRTNLHFMSTDRPLRRIVVTSAAPQEGKSTTSINTAITLAQSGAKVVLVDTDMRRPRLHRAFGVRGDVGLSTVMLGEAELSQALVPTPVPGLYLLPCGPVPPNPAELLHSARFAAVLEELDRRFERIVLDSPPLGAVADAKVLTAHADGAVLVARAGRTQRQMLDHAAGELAGVGGRILGVVLNDVDLSRREYGGAYYQYYRADDRADEAEAWKAG